MFVLRVTIIAFVNGAAANIEFSEQSGVNEFSKRAIDSWSANVTLLAFARQPFDQLVGVEMIVLTEDFVEQNPSLFRVPHPAALQILVEPLPRRQCDVDGI